MIKINKSKTSPGRQWHGEKKSETQVTTTVTLWLCQNSYWKWPFIVDFPINSMVIFHSYVKLPEGILPIASAIGYLAVVVVLLLLLLPLLPLLLVLVSLLSMQFSGLLPWLLLSVHYDHWICHRWTVTCDNNRYHIAPIIVCDHWLFPFWFLPSGK